MVITGIVVAFAATAMAVALLLRLLDAGASTLEATTSQEQDDRPS
jgi:multisubunit Na+/H+ antiporter MnhC subunit